MYCLCYIVCKRVVVEVVWGGVKVGVLLYILEVGEIYRRGLGGVIKK